MSQAMRIDRISTTMIFENPVPGPPLREHIESLIYFKGYQPEHSIERKVPNGTINLIFELDGMQRTAYDDRTCSPGSHFTRVWLAGMHRKFITFSTHKNSEMFVIQFKPGGGYPFLKRPIHELTEKLIDASDIFGAEINDFREGLLLTLDFTTKFKLAENWLIEIADFSLTPEKVIQNAVACIMGNASTRLRDLVAQSRYSRKQFIRLFKKYVGLPPKLFRRIMRFNEILQLVQNREWVSWAQISAECGYFDQAHFIRDFKAFSGFKPKEFLKAHLESERSELIATKNNNRTGNRTIFNILYF